MQKTLSPISPQIMLVATLVLPISLFSVLTLFPSIFYHKFDAASYLVFHNAVETFGIIVCLSIFGVGWYAHDQSKNQNALFLSCMFLGIGLVGFIHTLSFPGMPHFVTPNSMDKGIQSWLAFRLYYAGVFVASAYIHPNTKNRWLTKTNLLLFSVAVSMLVFTGVIYCLTYLPTGYIEGKGLTPFKIFAEYAITGLFVFSLVAYWSRFSRTHDKLLTFYLSALVLSIFSELTFTLYQSAYDSYNMLGHIFEVGAFYLIYKGIFAASVVYPYEKLKDTSKQLTVDVTRRKQAEEDLHRLNRKLLAISNCNQSLLRAGDEQTLLNDICRIICDEAGYRMAWVGFAENDEAKTLSPVAWGGVEDGYLADARLTWADTERGRGPAGTAIRDGRDACIQDFITDPQAAPWREGAVKRGYRSCVALPLKDESESIFGVLCIYSIEQNAFTPDEIQLLKELAGDLAFGITVLRGRTELKRAEQERLAHLRFFESMDRINRAIQSTNNLKQMMRHVLDAVLSIFDCDRAFLMYPGNHGATVWQVPMERSKPDYPGALALGTDVLVSPNTVQAFQTVKAASGPVQFGPGSEHPRPTEKTDFACVQSMLALAIHPKVDKPYVFGLHQCSYPRVWTAEEERLFQEIGRRLADGLTALLMYRDLQDSIGKLEEAQRIAHIGYWDRDIAGNRITLSDEVRRIFGISEKESVVTLEQWHERWLTLIHPEDRQRASQAFADALRSGPRYNVEYRIVRPDGEVRHIHSEANVTRDESGHPIRVLGMVQDITEQKSLQMQLLQAQKMEAVGALAGGIAHDFNNLLQVVLGYSDLILANENLPDCLRDDLEKVLLAGKNGADLVQRLLTFSRKAEAKPLDLDLNQRIRQTHKLLQRTIPMIDIELILAVDLARIHADPTQLDQVLMNLSVNARDAMPKGGKLVIETANVSLDENYERSHVEAKPGRYVLLSVSDTGSGMDKEILEHVFEPFYTTKETGKGTGLGLAVVYGIVTQHGGHIRCYSEPGQGTTFKIYLPALVPEREQLEMASRETMPSGGSETILLVDDKDIVRDLGKRVLERSGYTVLTASNGKEALDLYKREKGEISLVVLDLMMPEMGGRQCLEELLKIEPRVKVLIASGYAAEGQTKDIIETGARRFVGKPLDIRHMLRAVREVLDSD